MLRNGPFWTWEWAVLDVSWGRFDLVFFFHWGRFGFSEPFSTFIGAVLAMVHFGQFLWISVEQPKVDTATLTDYTSTPINRTKSMHRWAGRYQHTDQQNQTWFSPITDSVRRVSSFCSKILSKIVLHCDAFLMAISSLNIYLLAKTAFFNDVIIT